ncbi:hypothetical protein CONCODRAFT_74649 [Conidiobolus coronatus NRRL 28638]|uniref:Uncharacterized protein n=1 Tax=Conidiobolus coronatus (strain ATCC 28846 / CBS 209.66 / NRRL 28638) TaxID=796925 RepID=A0A137NPS3_CONC2|nr:hypothetical protein CONCODRAFT_74649 [Conidiobolus coronatus NRRL 28638]|eukprot:KXN64734.1 hypothetical protein CONCODRAFT_74649 [Conidiobolus coronatus NRRL 28638]
MLKTDDGTSRIEPYEVLAYIDGGSSANILHSGLIDRYDWGNKTQPSNTNLVVVTGTVSPADAEINSLTVTTGPISTNNRFIVANNPKLPILLGRPWLDKVNGIIDFRHSIISMQVDSLRRTCNLLNRDPVSPSSTTNGQSNTIGNPFKSINLVSLITHSDTIQNVHCNFTSVSDLIKKEDEYNIGKYTTDQEIKVLLNKFPGIVCKSFKNLRGTTAAEHKIKLIDPETTPDG